MTSPLTALPSRRTAQIEERLNGLVSLLQASGELPQNGQQPQSTPGSGESYEHDIDGASPSSTGHADPSISSPQNKDWNIPPEYNSFAQPNCICRPDAGPAPPPPASDEALLEVYRTQLQPRYPFVVVPPGVTAAQLQSTRPFVMAAIRMVASFSSLRSMRAQMCNLMKHIADHMLVRSERSMDLLLGIIVISGWYQYHCFAHAQLHNLISLAISLAGEMGLNRHPLIHEGTRMMAAQPPVPNVRSNEERRAFLGVWYLASSKAIVFGRIEPMRYTSYVSQCIKTLETEQEYESDIWLTFLIKLQHLTQRISELNPTDATVEEFSSIPKAPLSAYVAAFTNELDKLHEALPARIKENRAAQIYFLTARLRLYEPPVVDKALIASLSEAFTSNQHGAGTPLDRLYNTSAAVTAWFDNWLAIPVSEYYAMTTGVASQIVYALTMLGRWAQLSTPRPKRLPGVHSQAHSQAGDGLQSFELDRRNATRAGESPEERVHGVRPAFRSGQKLPPCEVDPSLTAAVAALQAQLQSHPALMVNIPDILSAICNRFEQANATFQISSTDAGASDNNMWSMTALKVRITRAKLEKWAEMVSKEGENHSPSQQLKADMDTSMSDWAFPQEQATGPLPDGVWNSLNPPNTVQPDQMQMQGNYGSMPWRSDLLTGVDPTVWFDGYLDWGAVIMNSMGTVQDNDAAFAQVQV